MLQFYVPMDFLEPSIIKGIGWFKEKFLLVMLYRYPAHHRKIDTAVQLLFRTLIVLFIGGLDLYVYCDFIVHVQSLRHH